MNWQRLIVCFVVVALVLSAVPMQTFARDRITIEPSRFQLVPPVDEFEPKPLPIRLPVIEIEPYPMPMGRQLDEAELADVEGENWQAGLIGAVGGLVGYAAGQLWDGVVHGDWSWDWADAGQAAFTGAIGGLFGVLIP